MSDHFLFRVVLEKISACEDVDHTNFFSPSPYFMIRGKYIYVIGVTKKKDWLGPWFDMTTGIQESDIALFLTHTLCMISKIIGYIIPLEKKNNCFCNQLSLWLCRESLTCDGIFFQLIFDLQLFEKKKILNSTKSSLPFTATPVIFFFPRWVFWIFITKTSSAYHNI